MDPYKILGITKNSTSQEIRQRYIFLAREYHPDKNGDIKKFQEIEYSYRLITDPKSLKARFPEPTPEPKKPPRRPKPTEPPKPPKKEPEKVPEPEPELPKKVSKNKFKKDQKNLDDFLNDLTNDFYKKTNTKKDRWN